MPKPARRLAALGAALVLAFAPATACAGEAAALRVAAASDLRDALTALAVAHKQAGGTRIETTFGSSGKLAAQIANGAPFDAFFSADASYTRDLEARGLVRHGSRFAYGVGRLALWTSAASGVDVSRGLAALDDPRVRRIAIANPAHAPYGRAAEAALRHAGAWEPARPRLVLGENASQAAQFATAGAAQVAFVPVALLTAPALRAGRHWLVPQAWHPPLVQEAVVLARAARPAAALAFFSFVRGPAGRRILAAHGFAPPPAQQEARTRTCCPPQVSNRHR